MRRDTFKLLIFAGILGFAVLYGMELSSKGIEDVKGPWETNSPTEATAEADDSDWTLPATGRARGDGSGANGSSGAGGAGNGTAATEWYEEAPGIPRNDREPIVDRVSGKTAEVLHDISRNGIRMVVSIFDKVLG